MTNDPGPAFGDEPITDALPDPLFLTPDHGVLHFEYRQLEAAGRDRKRLSTAFEQARQTDPSDPSLADQVTDILDRGPELPMRSDYSYAEPTELSEIRAASPDERPSLSSIDPAAAKSAIHGGWAGACAGCLLGKPVQGWSRDRIHGFLSDSGQWPLTDYLHSDVSPAVAERYAIHENLEDGHAFINEVEGMPIDDDIDYIVLGLEVLNGHGTDFTTLDIGNTWLESLPLFNTYTAERVAYRNLTNRITPPETATHRNPYREMIGALIRADPWGFVAMGDPNRAVELAHRDARLSHVKNGVYGELWAAAMIAAAPLVDSIETLLDVGLSYVPSNSRLAQSVATVRNWLAGGMTVEEAVERIHDRYDETDMYDWVHVLSNAEVATVALCSSEGDFADAITTAVAAGFDTDSHAATVGSILGAYHGIADLPDRFVSPLENRLDTSLPGWGPTEISSVADETYEIWASTVSA